MDRQNHRKDRRGPVTVEVLTATAQQVEVISERWRHARTGRWRTLWSAREVGAFGWHMASTPREAIKLALCIHRRRSPAVTAAAREARARLRGEA
jgi:hypothetical protein